MGGLDFTIYTKEDLKEAVQALGLWKILWKKAAFISAQWFSDFANFRRDGYDFDALYDDGLANYRDKELYELLERESPILSGELKRKGNYRKLPVYFKE